MENNELNNKNQDSEELDSLDILYGKPKMSKMDKFKNFIYYHKTMLLIGIAATVILGILIGQVATKSEPDISILYAGRYYIDPNSQESIDSALREILDGDYNGDGKLTIQFINRTIKTPGQHKQEQDESDELLYDSSSIEEMSMLNTELMAGESVICFIDENLYKNIENKERFVELQTLLGDTPENAVDEYAVYLKDTPFADICEEFKTLGKDTVVCIKRRVVTYDKEKYEYNTDAFKKLFAYEG